MLENKTQEKKIIFYYLRFCPRSYLSLKNLLKITQESEYRVEVKKGFIFKINGKISIPPVIVFDNKVFNKAYFSPDFLKNILKGAL